MCLLGGMLFSESIFEYEGGRLDDWDQQMLAFGVLHASNSHTCPIFASLPLYKFVLFIFDI